MKKWSSDPDNVMYVLIAYKNKKPVGALLLFFNSKLSVQGEEIGVYVKRKHRRNGIGRALYKKAKKFGADNSRILIPCLSKPDYYSKRSEAFYEAVRR